MKLPIKKEFFDAIEKGYKTVEWRDAHITFVCEKTGRTLRKDIKKIEIVDFFDLPGKLQTSGLFDDNNLIKFELK